MFGQRCRWMFATDRPPSRRAQKADGAGLLVSAHMLAHTLEPNEHRELDLGGARPRATEVAASSSSFESRDRVECVQGRRGNRSISKPGRLMKAGLSSRRRFFMPIVVTMSASTACPKSARNRSSVPSITSHARQVPQGQPSQSSPSLCSTVFLLCLVFLSAKSSLWQGQLSNHIIK